MSGPPLRDDQHAALAKWIDTIPELPRATVKDSAAVARGLALFGSAFLHNGCAATLLDRFGSCGGDAHGKTSTLSAARLSDLIAYLETL